MKVLKMHHIKTPPCCMVSKFNLVGFLLKSWHIHYGWCHGSAKHGVGLSAAAPHMIAMLTSHDFAPDPRLCLTSTSI